MSSTESGAISDFFFLTCIKKTRNNPLDGVILGVRGGGCDIRTLPILHITLAGCLCRATVNERSISEGNVMKKLTKLVAATIVAGTAALSVSNASAWWGGNDYWGGPWGGGPWYGGYPGYGWGGYPYYGGWGGYPGYGWGGYPGYGGWGGGYPYYGGWGGGYPYYGGWGGYGYPAYTVPVAPAAPTAPSTTTTAK
jgi:hypothetical protein